MDSKTYCTFRLRFEKLGKRQLWVVFSTEAASLSVVISQILMETGDKSKQELD